MSQPVTPNASQEAIDLLHYLSSISGKHTLTGQHCMPLAGSTRLAGVEKLTGSYPAVFGQDFGFSAAGTWDGINFRQQIVDEAIRRHNDGFIITLMWHAYADRDYLALLKLAGDKPVALGEVGSIPLVRILRKQARWTWFMYCHDPSTLHAEAKQVCETYRSNETLTLDQLPWVKGKTPRVHYPVMR